MLATVASLSVAQTLVSNSSSKAHFLKSRLHSSKAQSSLGSVGTSSRSKVCDREW